MGAFSAEWLRLREPVDHAARSAALSRDILRSLPRRPIGILDLACGTGSNFRYLGSLLDPADGDWLLVDHDPSLLIEASQRMRAWGEARGLVVSRDEGAWRVEGEGLAVTFSSTSINPGLSFPGVVDSVGIDTTFDSIKMRFDRSVVREVSKLP